MIIKVKYKFLAAIAIIVPVASVFGQATSELLGNSQVRNMGSDDLSVWLWRMIGIVAVGIAVAAFKMKKRKK